MKDRYEAIVQAYTDPTKETYRNAAASARHAGYKPKSAAKTAFRIFHLPQVKRVVEERLMIAEGREIDLRKRNWWRSKEGLIDKAGKFLEEVGGNNHAAKTKYLELLAKLQGFFESSINVTTICGVNVKSEANEVAVKFAQSIVKSNASNQLEQKKS